MSDTLIFERSRPGRRGYRFPALDIDSSLPLKALIPEHLMRNVHPILPEVSEIDVVRHYNHLSRKSFGVDFGFYPLGSCTMKYNPKVNDAAAHLEGFTTNHPLQPVESVQGSLRLMYELIQRLCTITGLRWGSLQPFAGAHGEFTGMKLFRAYFDHRGETGRKVIIVPSSSHGTNPASAHLAGFDVVEIPADSRGLVSLESLRPHLNDSLAGIMLTNPNTLGLFERDISEIAAAIHAAGGLLYYDGANMNAIMGKVRPGDMGFDVVHLNLHKTFSTPHGSGGPGAGPVFVSERIRPYLPVPDITYEPVTGQYDLAWERPLAIGKVSGFYGNFAVLVRAYTYILVMGANGLQHASEMAVLNANYLRVRLRDVFTIPYDATCTHEFVISLKELRDRTGISAIDVAKGLIDKGIHPPTMYFPLIVPEALMIEPTETETIETLDDFVDAMMEINERAEQDPDSLHRAPVTTPISRVDEVRAARNPVVRWKR